MVSLVGFVGFDVFDVRSSGAMLIPGLEPPWRSKQAHYRLELIGECQTEQWIGVIQKLCDMQVILPAERRSTLTHALLAPDEISITTGSQGGPRKQCT